MPQMNKGGKFIFGKSRIGADLHIKLPTQAVSEYHICDNTYVYLMTGSKVTGGFCVTNKNLLLPSKLGHILTDNMSLCECQIPEGEFIHYKGRSYCWLHISNNGVLQLSNSMMIFLDLSVGMELLSIRSSDIAFTMGAKGPLLEKARNYPGEIPVYI